MVRRRSSSPTPRYQVNRHNGVHVLIKACGGQRCGVGVIRTALVGDQSAYLIKYSLGLLFRTRRSAAISLGAWCSSRAAAAAPQEGEVTIVVDSVMVAAGWRYGAGPGAVVAVLAVHKGAVAAAACLDNVVAV